MLARAYEGSTELFVGSHVWHDSLQVPMAVRCVFEGAGDEWYGFVDTGSEFCIMPYALARSLGVDTEGGPDVPLSTRHGVMHGVVQELTVRLEAREGEALEVDAKWWISAQWEYGPVIGWHGFLESIRFACNPGLAPGDSSEFLYATR
jgi:hypothetical protein